jgi:uncharacterized membrane protein YgaE (UPF0421/DUF939 family)
MTTADSVLAEAEKMKYGDWFAAECEHVTALKNSAYERMQQRNHTQNAVEESCVGRREEKMVHKKKRRRRRKRNSLRINFGILKVSGV